MDVYNFHRYNNFFYFISEYIVTPYLQFFIIMKCSYMLWF